MSAELLAELKAEVTKRTPKGAVSTKEAGVLLASARAATRIKRKLKPLQKVARQAQGDESPGVKLEHKRFSAPHERKLLRQVGVAKHRESKISAKRLEEEANVFNATSILAAVEAVFNQDAPEVNSRGEPKAFHPERVFNTDGVTHILTTAGVTRENVLVDVEVERDMRKSGHSVTTATASKGGNVFFRVPTIITANASGGLVAPVFVLRVLPDTVAFDDRPPDVSKHVLTASALCAQRMCLVPNL